MYKDKDKQREANAERQRRYKAKQKGVTSEGVTDKALPDIKLRFNTGELSRCSEMRDMKDVLFKPERTAQGNIRVSKPGDSDYQPQFQQLQDGSLVGDGYVPT